MSLIWNRFNRNCPVESHQRAEVDHVHDRTNHYDVKLPTSFVLAAFLQLVLRIVAELPNPLRLVIVTPLLRSIRPALSTVQSCILYVSSSTCPGSSAQVGSRPNVRRFRLSCSAPYVPVREFTIRVYI